MYRRQHKDFTSEKSSDSFNSNLYFGNKCVFCLQFKRFRDKYISISFYSLKGALSESFYCTFPDFKSISVFLLYVELYQYTDLYDIVPFWLNFAFIQYPRRYTLCNVSVANTKNWQFFLQLFCCTKTMKV